MSLKVMGYNILLGGENRQEGIARVIDAEQPDLVALLEANSREGSEALASKLGMRLVFGEANTVFHIAWLSRLPVRREVNHRLPDLAKTLLEIEVVWDGEPLRLFAAHLGSRHDRPQPVDEVPVILDVLRPLVGKPHLLVGDFNSLRYGDPIGTPPPGVSWRIDPTDPATGRAIDLILEAGYTDCYRALHPESPGYTYRTDCPWLRLDYIFASPQMAKRLGICDVVDGPGAERASDHFPLLAEFR